MKWILNYTDHVLCSTCLGEYKCKSGYFGRRVVEDVITITPVNLSSTSTEHERYCCRCGAGTWVEAIWTFRGNRLCDGSHDVVEND